MWFFFPETRLRSLEEMDNIFKKSTTIFNAVDISLTEPFRYDKHGQLKQEFIEEMMHQEDAADNSSDGEKKTEL